MSSPLKIFFDKKSRHEKLAMISLYDAPSAQIACDNGVDVLLVGDSMGNVILGFESTLPVTLDDMIRHTGAVVRGVKSSSRPEVPVVADLSFGTYVDEKAAVKSAVALMQCGAHAVKMEGASPRILASIEAVIETGTPVMGHLGYTPQSSLQMQSVVQGKDREGAQLLLSDAKSLEKAGCFSVVLETVALQAAANISEKLKIATIGIGSGPNCDGQVLVWNDLIGLSPQTFKFVKRFGEANTLLQKAAGDYVNEVHKTAFPTAENGWPMDGE